MKSLITVRSRHAREFRLRQTIEKKPSIALRQHSGIQQSDDPAIARCTDEAPNSLTKFNQCIRQRQVVEGVSSAIPDMIAFRFGDGVGRWIKWEPGNDHLCKCIARDVDP